MTKEKNLKIIVVPTNTGSLPIRIDSSKQIHAGTYVCYSARAGNERRRRNHWFNVSQLKFKRLIYCDENFKPKHYLNADVLPDLLEEDRNKTFYLIEVKDNGIGFEQDYAEQIFKMFHRLHGKTAYSGAGIDLSIAPKVVENHQGYIWAKGASKE